MDAVKSLGSDSGFLLLDFPRTGAQAQALEYAFSGFLRHFLVLTSSYETPKSARIGNLKRNNGTKLAGADKKRSLLAPSLESRADKDASATSSLDAFFVLNVADEMAIRRSVGRRFDIVSGQV